ncbi:MAG: branched-chain amino acid ABC transporter permease [Paracoccaceae bacterium]
MENLKITLLFALVVFLILITGFVQSWNTALLILNMGLISAIMSLGVNLQWGFAGLFNVGIMGFVALGGLAAVLVSAPPVYESWSVGGIRIIAAIIFGVFVIITIGLWIKKIVNRRQKFWGTIIIALAGFFIYRAIFDTGVVAVEAVNPASTGYLGGLGWPILMAWPIGGLLAAGAAWVIGKTALGLRSDYLAIATLGIAEIIIAIIKNEDWLARGVKNVIGLPRPAPYEIDLQQSDKFVSAANSIGIDPVTASTLYVKLIYAGLFSIVLIMIFILAQRALHSPWGRMMRAIRDNEVAAEAMGKNVTGRHLQIFILGSAICGIAGAMMTTLDSQLTPGTYQPLRYTFLIWVMVIIGGSGNNLGAVLGGFIIWFLWVQVEPIGQFLMVILTSGLAEDNSLKLHLMDSVAHMRLLTMGLLLLLVLRFSPRGLIPEK